MFEGSAVAIVTPMNPKGEIDRTALANLIEWHIQEGTKAIIVAGSTGESATLTEAEQATLITLALQVVKKRIPVIAGTGTNATSSTISRSQVAYEKGVDACLIVTPYYNRPTQFGLIQHFSSIASAVNVPILLYNVPNRTGCDILPETVALLSDVPNIVGIKEATGNLARLRSLTEKCKEGFKFYSGDDPTACEFILGGGHGVISITSNVAPNLMDKMCGHALAKIKEKAHEQDERLQPLHHALIIEPNPIPVKWALHKMGKIEEGIRLPLTHLSEPYHDKMCHALKRAGILIK